MKRSTLFLFILGLACAVSARAQSAAPKLSSEDYAEIMMLYAQYPLMLDSGNAEGYANLFTEDGSFGDRVVGRAALMEFAGSRTLESSAGRRHVHMTPVITPTAEGATGTVMNFFIDVSSNPPAIQSVSQYTDTLVKTPNGWRFLKRVNGAVPGAPARGGPPPGAQAGPGGAPAQN